QRDRKDPDGWTYAFGAGFRQDLWADMQLRADYAYEVHPVLDATHYFGLSLGFTFNPTPVKFEEPPVGTTMFASLRHSEASGLGTVRLRNVTAKNVPTQVSVTVPELRFNAFAVEFFVPARQPRAVPLR